MAIKTFKEILDNKGYRINSKDRAIFEQGNLQSFFGFGEQDAIEFIIYDINDNQLPQKDGNLIRYVPLSDDNIRDYFMTAEGTIFSKYQLPSEYFIDVERLLREAGYNNGIFKTQITLLNKRVGNDGDMDKLWISEISPSRTEIRLFPIRNNDKVNTDLEQRYNLFINNGEFRDDTINLALNFIEKITPIAIDSFIKNKYGESWYDKLAGEFKIADFRTFLTKVHDKFVESCIYEFSHRVSDIKSTNYGKPLKTKTPLSLSKNDIRNICKRLLVTSVNFYLPTQDIKTIATFDTGINSSIDEVGQILQRLEVNTIIDTSSPVLNVQKIKSLTQTDVQLELEDKIKKELPIDKSEKEIKIVTPDGDADYTPSWQTDVLYKGGYNGTSGPGGVGGYDGGGRSDYVNPTPPSYSGGGGSVGTRDFMTDYGTGNPWDGNNGKMVANEYTMDALK